MSTPRPKQTAMRFSDEDLAIIDAVGKHYGIPSRTQTIKTAMRALAKILKINVKEKP